MLGTRKAESQRRQRNMEKLEQGRARRFAEPRDRLTPNAKLPNSLVYTPIEDWTNDDVWLFLMQVKNPWGHTNKSLLTMYQGASPTASARWCSTARPQAAATAASAAGPARWSIRTAPWRP